MRAFATLSLLCLAAIGAGAAPARAHHPDGERTFRGTLEVAHGDDFRSGTARKTYTLVHGGRRMTFVPTRATRVRRRARVVVRGRRVGGRVVGAVRSRRELALASNHVPAAGPRKVLVLLFNFAGDTREPWTVDHVRARLFTDPDSTAAFYAEQSYGRTQLVGRDRADGDVGGWYTIAASGATCDVNAWTSQARQAARDAGLDLSGYDHTMYAFPGQSSCGWAGLGHLGDSAGGWSWLNGDISVRVAAHELGHNLGLHHASSYSCTDEGGQPVAISSNCTIEEYGDRFDVMGGYGDNHSHGWHLQRLGYLAPENVRTVTASGTYTLRSAIAPSSDVQLLRIPRTRNADGSVRDYYYLDLRTAGGVFDDFLSTDPVVRGVSIRVNREPSVMTQSWLLDATPGSGSFFRDASLTPGQTFSDGEVTITTTAVSGDTATLELTVPVVEPAPATEPPAQSPEPSGGGGGTPPPEPPAGDDGTTPPPSDTVRPRARLQAKRQGRGRSARVLLQGSARDDVRVTRIELWIDGVRRKTVRGASLKYGWLVRQIPRGRHRVVLRAYDASGNAGSASTRIFRR